jgi:polysaccharide export outer membrane protein
MNRTALPFAGPILLAAGLVAAAETEGASATTSAYRVGVEDEVRVFVWGEDDLSGRFRVRPDGKITVPLVRDIEVAGATTEEVRERIVAALTRYIREPNVTVIVEAINSYRVYFLGEIGRQGALQFYRPTRILQGIAAAGGLTEFAKKEITLIREENGTEKRVSIDYKRLIGGDPAEENFFLLPGDTLIFH